MLTAICRVVQFFIMMTIVLIDRYVINRQKKDGDPYGKSHAGYIDDPERWAALKIFGENFWRGAENYVTGVPDEVAETMYGHLMTGEVAVVYLTDKDGNRHVFKKNRYRENSVVMEVLNDSTGTWEVVGRMEIDGKRDFVRRPECGWDFDTHYRWVNAEDYNGR